MSVTEWFDDYLRELQHKHGSWKKGLEIEGGIVGALEYYAKEELPKTQKYLKDIMEVEEIVIIKPKK